MSVAGGVSARPLANGQAPLANPDLLSASTTIIQSGGGAFARLINALQLLDQSGQVIELASNLATLQADITTLQGQVATLQGQVSTLQTQVATLNAGQNYTGLEVNTGASFITGQLIYRRTFNFQIGNIVNAAFLYPHGIPAFQYLVNGQGTMVVSATIGLPLTYINMIPSPPVDGCAFYVDPTNIYVLNGNANRSAYTFVITLWYTATDR